MYVYVRRQTNSSLYVWWCRRPYVAPLVRMLMKKMVNACEVIQACLHRSTGHTLPPFSSREKIPSYDLGDTHKKKEAIVDNTTHISKRLMVYVKGLGLCLGWRGRTRLVVLPRGVPYKGWFGGKSEIRSVIVWGDETYPLRTFSHQGRRLLSHIDIIGWFCFRGAPGGGHALSMRHAKMCWWWKRWNMPGIWNNICYVK